jgi:hypothetical protein
LDHDRETRNVKNLTYASSRPANITYLQPLSLLLTFQRVDEVRGSTRFLRYLLFSTSVTVTVTVAAAAVVAVASHILASAIRFFLPFVTSTHQSFHSQENLP